MHDQQGERAVEAALEALDESGLLSSKVRVSSFSLDAIQLIRCRRPGLGLGLAADKLSGVPTETLETLGLTSIHLDIRYLDPLAVELAADRGLKVCVYTVHSARQLASLPVNLIDSVFTDDPVALQDEIKTLKIFK